MMTAERLPLKKPSTRHRDRSDEADNISLRERTVELLSREISFIPNKAFLSDGKPDDYEPIRAHTKGQPTRSNAAQALPAHLARLCETELLTADQERELFRRMNQLKFWANRLRCRLDPERPDWASVQCLTRYLDESDEIRNHLIKSNVRLVLSIARKFVTPQNSFDELLSEGLMCMMHAVEKFDFDRGFRFSTYAYRSISRGLGRTVRGGRRRTPRMRRFDLAAADRVEDTSRSISADRLEQTNRELLTKLVNQLDRRERFIIRSRFALGAHRKRRSCRELGERLGISKERVRQLEQRALSKIRDMIDDQ